MRVRPVPRLIAPVLQWGVFMLFRRWLSLHKCGFYVAQSLLLMTVVAGSPADAAPAPQPLPRSGSCPTGYHASGQYCVPGPSARYAIERNGSCPVGYFSSARYCVASSDKSALAIHRSGPCPGGYFASGKYCLESGE